MLVSIECDKFAKAHRKIDFNPGLNTIMGSSVGSNAIGKSTFLWIIDYVFGGETYYTKSTDVKDGVGSHTIYFTFDFEGHPHYFYRTTDDPKTVYRCDKAHHMIEKLTLDEYRAFLYQEYAIGLPKISFDELIERYFRIYGRENTNEKYPLHIKPREPDEKAINFLLRLFNKWSTLAAIEDMEEQLGIKASQLKSRPRQQVDSQKIEDNIVTIESLKERLNELKKNNEVAQLSVLGFDTSTMEKLMAARRELSAFVNKRNRLQSQFEAIKDNMNSKTPGVVAEFDSLLYYFPEANVRELAEIENFHINLREILHGEMSGEIERLQRLIGRYDAEINRLEKKIHDSGFTQELSERLLSQCISVARAIEKLEEENEELLHQQQLQADRAAVLNKLEMLLRQQSEALQAIQAAIDQRMRQVNAIVTEEQETSPVLLLSDDKTIVFRTPGNTSEGAAYKSLVVYDLSIVGLCPIPALVHDSNILKRIADVHLEHILELYEDCGKQVFIAFDKPDSTSEKAATILNSTTVLPLSDGNELFGRSWSKQKPKKQEVE